MRGRLLAILLGLTVRATMTPPLFAQQLPAQSQTTNTETIRFAPGGTIRVEHSYGDLSIDGWDRPEVEITVIKSLPYGYKLEQPQEATKHWDRIQVMTERKSDNELVISTSRQSKDDVMVEYRIHAPQDSKLVIHNGPGFVIVSDMTGDTEATGSRGDIVLMLPEQLTYKIDAKTKLGTIVSDFKGHSRKHHLTGRSFISANESASRSLRLRMGYGGISIKAAPARPSANQSTVPIAPIETNGISDK
jgi:hypothetical protein